MSNMRFKKRKKKAINLNQSDDRYRHFSSKKNRNQNVCVTVDSRIFWTECKTLNYFASKLQLKWGWMILPRALTWNFETWFFIFELKECLVKFVRGSELCTRIPRLRKPHGISPSLGKKCAFRIELRTENCILTLRLGQARRFSKKVL